MNISITKEEFTSLIDAMEHVRGDLECCMADENEEVVIEMQRTMRCLSSIRDKYEKSQLNLSVRKILKQRGY